MKKIELIERNMENHREIWKIIERYQKSQIDGNIENDLFKLKCDGDLINHNSKIQLIYSQQHRFELMWHYI